MLLGELTDKETKKANFYNEWMRSVHEVEAAYKQYRNGDISIEEYNQLAENASGPPAIDPKRRLTQPKNPQTSPRQLRAIRIQEG